MDLNIQTALTPVRVQQPMNEVFLWQIVIFIIFNKSLDYFWKNSAEFVTDSFIGITICSAFL